MCLKKEYIPIATLTQEDQLPVGEYVEIQIGHLVNFSTWTPTIYIEVLMIRREKKMSRHWTIKY